MRLYEEKEQTFSEELFKHPTAKYRAAPFWAWNCYMTEENIDRIIRTLEIMGMGGGYLHCRTGMANPYLGDEFMRLVRYTNQEFKKRNMFTWLYDEDRWPSGAGGGYVTRDHQYRMRFLVFGPDCLDHKVYDDKNLTSSGQAVRSNERKLLARYAVALKDGFLASYRLLKENDFVKAGEQEWFAYLEVSGDNPWFNNEAYLNTLDKNAVEKFIEITHETYAREFQEEFGKSMPAIFTDEPQFTHKQCFKYPEDQTEIVLPFTDDLETTFIEQYGHSLLEHLPELFWELPAGEFSVIRYEYHEHIAERFASSFSDTVGKWCMEHHIALTGHMMEEPTLKSQTAALGEAMRSYRGFEIPGIDMLCHWIELSTAKQAQSAVHQYGREGMMSELYGVTNWDFDFRGHKLRGDWQAALGVTHRVPHLTWTSMAGEAKRDYPASIGFQSPWYQEYRYVEDYFSRLNTVLTRGKAQVRIGVIHPIESYWLYWGNEEQTGAIRKEMDEDFKKLIEELLYGLQDFDFISEALLADLTNVNQIHGEKFPVGEMEYDVVVVPGCITLRKTTMDFLECYAENGGKVIFVGRTPDLVEVKPSQRPGKLVSRCSCIAFSREALMQALEPYRLLDVREENGLRTDNLIYQLRRDEDQSWLFLSHVRPTENMDVPKAENLRITLQGEWEVEECDAIHGSFLSIAYFHKDGKTILYKVMYEQDSLLLKLTDAKKGVKDRMFPIAVSAERYEERRIIGIKKVPITLEEPNVLVLDQAEYRFDDGEWQPQEEILRIDNQFRTALGYPLRMEAFAQPWLENTDAEEEHTLELRMKIDSDTEIPQVRLGMEDAQTAEIVWNGKPAKPTGNWYVDPCICEVLLGNVQKGQNELLVRIPFYSKCNVEAMYLLGDFGVRVEGSYTMVTQPVRELGFGDVTNQGLPFYGGNIVYHVPVILEKEEDLTLQISKYRAAVLKVAVDGKEVGYIAYSPYCLKLGKLTKGEHKLNITCFGNRVNTFGTLHNCDEQTEWYGPNAWRTTGSSWAYEYQLRRNGILKSPVVLTCD